MLYPPFQTVRRRATIPALLSIALGVLLTAPALVAFDAAQEPVYIYLYARVTDHVNLDITEDRLHRLLPLLEKYQQAQPQAHMVATVLFSGAVSKALADRNQRTHIVDFVRDYIRRGTIEVGYDGADEPTYEHRPLLDFTGVDRPEDRWLVRQAAGEKLLGEARDPLTGAPQPDSVGALKEMREVFGDPVCVTGMTMWMSVNNQATATHANPPGEPAPDPHFNQPLKRKNPPLAGLQPEVGGDSELITLLRRDNIKTIMFGIPDVNPGFIPGFSMGKEAFGKFMSPESGMSPELYWQDDVLRSSEASGVVRIVHASDGPEALKTMIGKLDRTKLHIIHVELSSEQNYLQPAFVKGSEFPPVKYAYDHPDAPRLQPSALLPAAGIDASFAKEDDVLKWAVENLFPAAPGSRMVSSTDLMKIAAPSSGFNVSVADMRAPLAAFLKLAGNDTVLPPSLQVGGNYLSFANLFQVMTDALAELSTTGKLPASVKVVQVYGPINLLTGHGPNSGEVSIASIAKVCAQIAPALHDGSVGKIPKNAIPDFVRVDGINMNPAQFMRLMARVLSDESLSPNAKLGVKMTYPYTSLLMAFPKTRIFSDDGFGWTLKPAVLEKKLVASGGTGPAR